MRCDTRVLAVALLASNIVWMSALTAFGVPLVLAKIITEIVLFVTSYRCSAASSSARIGGMRNQPELVSAAHAPHRRRIATPIGMESSSHRRNLRSSS